MHWRREQEEEKILGLLQPIRCLRLYPLPSVRVLRLESCTNHIFYAATPASVKTSLPSLSLPPAPATAIGMKMKSQKQSHVRSGHQLLYAASVGFSCSSPRQPAA